MGPGTLGVIAFEEVERVRGAGVGLACPRYCGFGDTERTGLRQSGWGLSGLRLCALVAIASELGFPPACWKGRLSARAS